MLTIIEKDPSALDDGPGLPIAVDPQSSEHAEHYDRGLGSIASVDSATSDSTAKMPQTPQDTSPLSTGDSMNGLPFEEQRRSRPLSASFPTAPAPTPDRNGKYRLDVDVSPINLSMSPAFRSIAAQSPSHEDAGQSDDEDDDDLRSTLR